MPTHLKIDAADGVVLHAVEAGKGERVIVFIPGFPEFWGAWHRQLAEFGRDFRAVALDPRGYNLSDKPLGAGNYALPKIVADLREAIRRLSPHQPVVVVGHDWGGISAWALTREHPELIDRLVILNAPHPAIFGREVKHNSAQRLASSYVALFNLPGVAELVLKAFRYAALRKMIFGVTTKPENFSPDLRAAYLDAWSQPRALTGGLNYYRAHKTIKETSLPPWTGRSIRGPWFSGAKRIRRYWSVIWSGWRIMYRNSRFAAIPRRLTGSYMKSRNG